MDLRPEGWRRKSTDRRHPLRLSPVTPQPRGVVPPEHAARIIAARDARDTADQDYRTAVVDALKAGASVREVAKLAGLSTNTVDRWGREGGWPTVEQKAAWEAAREANSEWNRRLRAAEGLAQHVTEEDADGDQDAQ